MTATTACRTAAALLGLAAAAAAPRASAQTVFAAAGPNAAALQNEVGNFRAALGTLNPNAPGSFAAGRREINWDGVPAQFASPDPFPPDFFNANSPRGLAYAPGTALQVSSTAVGSERFANLNPQYASAFTTFSAPRLFTSVGTNAYDVLFFVPGSSAPATTSAFGAVFADVDLANTTSLEFFTVGGASLGRYFAAAFGQGLSFLGVQFSGADVARVRVTNGNTAIGATDGGTVDVVVNDDFIYAEPQAAQAVIPEPSTWALVGAGLAAVAASSRRRRAAAA
jgi:hypothetical protein